MFKKIKKFLKKRKNLNSYEINTTILGTVGSGIKKYYYYMIFLKINEKKSTLDELIKNLEFSNADILTKKFNVIRYCSIKPTYITDL